MNGAYIPVLLSDAPDASRVFPYLWVDSESKPRLTIQDRKSYGASEDYVNVPTPTPHTNALMELLASIRGWPLYFFYVTTAYPPRSGRSLGRVPSSASGVAF